MDINQARTFLEVASCGSFIMAAERMHVTQTAVSARIRTLEQQLGRQLFVRNKAGARLTPAGERFMRHAATMVQVWERARHQVALPPGRDDAVSIGCNRHINIIKILMTHIIHFLGRNDTNHFYQIILYL